MGKITQAEARTLEDMIDRVCHEAVAVGYYRSTTDGYARASARFDADRAILTKLIASLTEPKITV